MKWFSLLVALVALFCSVMAQHQQDRAPDYTDRWAELASPVPANVNLDELVASLRAAGHS